MDQPMTTSRAGRVQKLVGQVLRSCRWRSHWTVAGTTWRSWLLLGGSCVQLSTANLMAQYPTPLAHPAHRQTLPTAPGAGQGHALNQPYPYATGTPAARRVSHGPAMPPGTFAAWQQPLAPNPYAPNSQAPNSAVPHAASVGNAYTGPGSALNPYATHPAYGFPAGCPPTGCPPRGTEYLGRPAPNPKLAPLFPVPTLVRLQLETPPDVKVVFYSGDGRDFPVPTDQEIQLRTLFHYLFELSGPEIFRGQKYYGSVEMLAAPKLPDDISFTEAPIPVHITFDDILDLNAHRMVTKVIVLEDPKVALNDQGLPIAPIRYDVSYESDPIDYAKSLGQMMLVVRLGDREPTPAERIGLRPPEMRISAPEMPPEHNQYNLDIRPVAHGWGRRCLSRHSLPPWTNPATATASDIPPAATAPAALIPPSNSQGTANCPPGLASAGDLGTAARNEASRTFRVVDPSRVDLIADPQEELVCDGGDRKPHAGFNNYGQLLGVDAGDTLAEFVDGDGRRRLVPSNCVCIFAPRYVEVRFLQGPDLLDYMRHPQVVRLEITDRIDVGLRREAEKLDYLRLQALRMRERASLVLSEQWDSAFTEFRRLDAYDLSRIPQLVVDEQLAVEISQFEQPFLAERIEYARELSLTQFPQVLAEDIGPIEVAAPQLALEVRHVKEVPKPCPLILEKCASVSQANRGDIVTFTIRYHNPSKHPVQNVAIVDNLIVRLEYVSESARSSRAAIFTANPNEYGSSKLIWELRDPIEPDGTGEVEFKAIIR